MHADAATPTRGPSRRPRVAYLSFSSGEFDARTMRMARSAMAAGYDVTVYARWHPGLPPIEERDGYRLIRAPFDWELAIPWLRRAAYRRAQAAMAEAAAAAEAAAGADEGHDADEGDDETGQDVDAAQEVATPARASFPRRVLRRILAPARRWWRVTKIFPLRPLAWAWALDRVTEPADIWHGLWAGSLPALQRSRRRHGGRTIYDSRDVYMRSREFDRLRPPLRTVLANLERRWAHGVDRVLTVNEPYADLLVEQLRIPRPPVVMNCPERWSPPDPPPDLIRQALGLPASTRIAVYQGHFTSERGIEQTMEAILDVPNAVLVLLGFGVWLTRLTAETSAPPYAGRVYLLPPVPPDELLSWTASADVSVVAIQPTTENHRYTTPQKLFESIAAGVPVVAADLPGMADIVRRDDLGVLVDPQSPASIAAAIRQLVDAPEAERQARRAHVLEVAHERYDWESQVTTLLGVYAELAPGGR